MWHLILGKLHSSPLRFCYASHISHLVLNSTQSSLINFPIDIYPLFCLMSFVLYEKTHAPTLQFQCMFVAFVKKKEVRTWLKFAERESQNKNIFNVIWLTVLTSREKSVEFKTRGNVCEIQWNLKGRWVQFPLWFLCNKWDKYRDTHLQCYIQIMHIWIYYFTAWRPSNLVYIIYFDLPFSSYPKDINAFEPWNWTPRDAKS